MDTFNDKMKQSCSFLFKVVFKLLGINVSPTRNFAYKVYSIYMMILVFLYPCGNLHVLLKNLDNYDVLINTLFNVIGGTAGKPGL